jgi:hypothetical protein
MGTNTEYVNIDTSEVIQPLTISFGNALRKTALAKKFTKITGEEGMSEDEY